MFLKAGSIDEFEGFANRLVNAAMAQGIKETVDLAEVLDNNDECQKLIKIRNKKKNKAVNPLNNIVRNIQLHLNTKNAYEVPSKYIYAYSLVLDCSIDYLYGKTDVMSTNLEVRDICEKTGLSDMAVNNLVTHNRNNDEEMSLTKWWSDLLSENSFFLYPIEWREYANRLVEIADIKNKAEEFAKDNVDSETDDIYKILSGEKADTLKIILREKQDASFGAYLKMISSIEEDLKIRADDWAAKQRPDYDKMYYKSAINKIKIIESALKG